MSFMSDIQQLEIEPKKEKFKIKYKEKNLLFMMINSTSLRNCIFMITHFSLSDR